MKKKFPALAAVLLLLLGSCGKTIDPKKVTHTLVSSQSTPGKMDLTIAIPRQYGKDTLIELARHYKKDLKWPGEFHAGFYNDIHPEHGYAAVSYLPGCRVCTTDADAAGDSVRYVENKW